MYGQDLTGIWEVRRVFAGEEEMTPVAKWIKIFPDSTYTSGNGWMQNARGTWAYNREESSFLTREENGIRDPYGAFTLILEDDKMVWERMENGDEVSIYLQRTGELPMAPQDLLTGLWELREYRIAGKDQLEKYDPENQVYFHFRWDKIYRERTPSGTLIGGYWQMNSHRPELILIPEDENLKRNTWKVRFQGESLILTSGTEDPVTRVFHRIHEFPE